MRPQVPRPFIVHRALPGTRRSNASYQPPSPPSGDQSNPHRDFYKTFGRPVAKNFLIAFCTYQFLYWGWLKLESMEMRKEKEEELSRLEAELKTFQREKETAAVTIRSAPETVEGPSRTPTQSWKAWFGL
ncbi:hypothetical protein K431DRAFT_299997 [Polychaeton citri CBS 116435]|uniref:Uncharacterized protein n=1 Tax=Polychaeton citri CBS 116435 TaxID=1314669 RepID=A0A9P4QIS3_9PEZI|nr:hypothetical protein K431DRAFT_299997 [Polychaeton citri CBS 116435]